MTVAHMTNAVTKTVTAFVLQPVWLLQDKQLKLWKLFWALSKQHNVMDIYNDLNI